MFRFLCIALSILVISTPPALCQELQVPSTEQIECPILGGAISQEPPAEAKEQEDIRSIVDEILEKDAVEYNNSIVVDPMPNVKCSDGSTVEITECIGEVRHRKKNKIINFIAPGRREWVYDTLDGRKVRSKKEFQLTLDNRTMEQKHPRWMLALRAIMATVAAGTLAF